RMLCRDRPSAPARSTTVGETERGGVQRRSTARKRRASGRGRTIKGHLLWAGEIGARRIKPAQSTDQPGSATSSAGCDGSGGRVRNSSSFLGSRNTLQKNTVDE